MLPSDPLLLAHFAPLSEPTPDIVAAFSAWENDPELIPFSRPNPNAEALQRREPVTRADLLRRLERHHIYLIYLDGQLVGEMDYQIDPSHLYKPEAGTAWIGITIGEAAGRGKGLGGKAMQFLEAQIKAHGLARIELGVFAFNTPAIRLYQKLQYLEIGRINDFTYWQTKMWPDIRMEKYFNG